MAIACGTLRTNLARQTPVYDEVFLKDFISDMVNEPFVGRHQTEIWEDGADTRTFDKVNIMQPDFTTPWQPRIGGECLDTCDAPRVFVGYGTTRDTYFMENLTLNSQPFCLDQLRKIPKVGKQIAEIYRVLRKMPLAFNGDFVRTRQLSYNDTLYICGAAFNTFAVTTGNTATQLTTINLGTTALLPTSELTLQYLNYYGQILGLRGYDQESGLMKGMRNLITHSRCYQKLVGLNPEVRSQIRFEGVKDVSPLYMPGTGINADPFGPFAPTFDEKQIRFQHSGNGLLQRVLPYLNTPTTTGEKPIENPAWVNAQYALSQIIHPKAYTVFTPKPKKIHEMVPTVNSAMWGAWDFINPLGVIQIPNADGTSCTYNNDKQWWFYWLCYLELGFKYEQRPLVINILHQIDGSGQACMVDQPVCGQSPQYVAQNYDGSPIVCMD